VTIVPVESTIWNVLCTHNVCRRSSTQVVRFPKETLTSQRRTMMVMMMLHHVTAAKPPLKRMTMISKRKKDFDDDAEDGNLRWEPC